MTYSGTLGAVAGGLSQYVWYATNGVPTVWAAAARTRSAAVNSAMPVTTGGFGNAGIGNVAPIEIEGTIVTVNAGNLVIELQSAAANGIVPKAGSRLDVEDITDAI